MSVLTLAARAAQANTGEVPCRTYDSEMWFSEEQVEIDRAQKLCRACPLQAACLAGALERKEPVGVWGGELFEKGQIVAQRKPKGRPRKDAELIERRAQERLARRLNEVSAALDPDDDAKVAEVLASVIQRTAGAA